MFKVLTFSRGSYRPLLVVTLLLCVIFAGGLRASETGWQAAKEVPQQGQNDPRRYQAIVLDNGMRVLLVSDPETPKAMVSLAVGVGHLQSPVTHPSLAHYLEHAILLGSNKFPGGINNYFSNTTTDYNETLFSSSFNNNFLPMRLAQLADAIATPLFDPKKVSAELQAIDSEASMGSNNEPLRILQVDKETLNSRHPHTQFHAGNLQPLSDKTSSKLLQELKEFHQRYYSANLISLVIYGNQPLEVLRYLALHNFGPLENRRTQVTKISEPIATAKQLGVLTNVVSREQSSLLQVKFIVAPEPLGKHIYYYLNYLIAHKGSGTLFDWLLQQGLAENLSSSADSRQAGNGGLLTIRISLTTKGLAERDRVLAALFTYLRLIEKGGSQHSYFSEMAKMDENKFNYATIERNQDYTKRLLRRLPTLPTKDLIHGGLMGEFDPKAIKDRLALMVPEKARIFFVSQQEPHDRKTEFFQIPFKQEAISNKQKRLWHKLGKEIDLKLPPLNPYLPTDFTLLPQIDGAKPRTVASLAPAKTFFMSSRHGANLPHANIRVVLKNESTMNNFHDLIKFKLLNELFWLASWEMRQQAQMAGMQIQLYEWKNLEIDVNGFSQHLPSLLENVLSHYANFAFNTQQLKNAKEWYRKELDVAEKRQPYEQALDLVWKLGLKYHGEKDQLLKALESITCADLLTYRSQLLSQSQLSILALGNLSEQQASDLTQGLQKKLGATADEPKSAAKLQIQGPQKALLTVKTSASDASLSAIYIPAGYSKQASRAQADLLANIINRWFFDKLRTEEQLGYVAQVSVKKIGEQSGLAFTVQSKDKSPAFLYQRYQEFYQQAWSWLQELQNPREFFSWQRHVLDHLEESPQNLCAEAERLREDFLEGNDAFNSREQLIEAIKKLTAAELLTFYQQAVLEPTGLALLCQVQGKQPQSKEAPVENPFATPEGWVLYPTVSDLQKRLFPQLAP